MTSDFRAINNLPRAQWDETEFRLIMSDEMWSFIHIDIFELQNINTVKKLNFRLILKL